ncbi:MAG TPA: tetratricopeptide repeat protein [Burkholderiaceae bacterium]|nr:tetratricopeptide repeat protein [Burkholderiaceae bacterium]
MPSPLGEQGPAAAPATAPATTATTGTASQGEAAKPGSSAAETNVAEVSAATRMSAALRKGDKNGALKIADEFLATHPRDAQVRFLRAVVLGDLNRQQESVAALESLTQDFPELPEPYNNLAVIHASQGQFASAERYLQLAIAARPNYVTAQENLGDLYVSMAAASYEKASKLAPENGALKTKLNLTRELSGKLRNAH